MRKWLRTRGKGHMIDFQTDELEKLRNCFRSLVGDEDSESRVIDFKKRGEGFYQKVYGVWYDLPSIQTSKHNQEQRLIRRVNGIDELIREYSSRIASMRREKVRLLKQIQARRNKAMEERASKTSNYLGTD